MANKIAIVPMNIINQNGEYVVRYGLTDGEGFFAYHYSSEHNAQRVAEKIEKIADERGPGILDTNFAYGNGFIFAD